MSVVIRRAELCDLPAIAEIYNYEVLNGVATFDLNEKPYDAFLQWFYAHNVKNHPLIVACVNGEVAGYASLSGYREKEAYSGTVELSLYVALKHRKKGVATALMNEILALARKDNGTHTVVSVITAGNAASVRLHQKYGFAYCGTMPNVGIKFGRLLSIDNYCLSV